MLRTFFSSLLCLCFALSLPALAQEPAAAVSQSDSAQTAPPDEPEQSAAEQGEQPAQLEQPEQAKPAEAAAAESAEPPAAASTDATAEPAPEPMPLTASPSTDESAQAGEQAGDQAAEETAEARQARLNDLLSLVKDNELYLQKREYPAYFALLKEVVRQTPQELRAKARENPRFDEFYRDPSKHRGELVHLALNARRVLPHDINYENAAGVTKLYEIWGWTDEAKAWMYCCITPELPPGFPTEGDIAERIELTGYFFKMQAYQPGDAAPNARNLVAPLVIGRITSAPKAPGQPAEGLGNWPFFIIGGFGLIILMRLLMQARLFTRPGTVQRSYRRRSLEPLDADNLSDSLGTTNRGLPIRNADD